MPVYYTICYVRMVISFFLSYLVVVQDFLFNLFLFLLFSFPHRRKNTECLFIHDLFAFSSSPPLPTITFRSREQISIPPNRLRASVNPDAHCLDIKKRRG